MVSGYATLSNMGVPYAVLGEGTPGILVIPGIEPEHLVPEGLRLQGVRGAFEELAEERAVAVAWRANRAPEEMTIGSIAADYVDLARELELTDLTIVSVSTGCAMAIETAARLGSRCRTLVLVSGGAVPSEIGRALLRRSAELAGLGRWRALAREQMIAFYPGLFGRTVLAGVAWLFPALYGEPDDPAYFMRLCTLAAEADLRRRSEDVSARTLVVNGERDVIYPPDVARETALLLADGELVTIPRAGHGAFKSHAGRIHRLIRSWIHS